jgi:Fur family peroxide stress response transcriptional regulator
MNYSKQRDIILETLKNNVVHPTAEYLYGILKEKNSGISLATLYRNLNQLSENGIIKKIDGLETSSHFDHNTHEHYHFICDECKRVFDVPVEVAPNIVSKTEETTGFDVKGYDVVLHGICKDCKLKNM